MSVFSCKQQRIVGCIDQSNKAAVRDWSLRQW